MTFQVKFYIISHDFWENFINLREKSTSQLPKIISFYNISHDTSIAN